MGYRKFLNNKQENVDLHFTGEDVTKELLFRVVEEKEQEEEILSVEIDSFLLDDVHIRVVDLIAEEFGMRLKIHGLTDNTGGGAEHDKIDEMLPGTVLEDGYRVAASWENEALIERIDQAIGRLEESGELQKVMDRHFGWKKE